MAANREPGAPVPNASVPGAPVPGAARMQILEETFRQRDLTSAERNELISLIRLGNKDAAYLARAVVMIIGSRGDIQSLRESNRYMLEIIDATTRWVPHYVPKPRSADGGRRRSRRTRRHRRK